MRIENLNLVRSWPFVNELCLLMLVAVHHQVERELVLLAAKVAHDDELTLSGDEYRHRVTEERELFKYSRDRLVTKLRLTVFEEWKTSVKALRLLANIYKHAPHGGPEGRTTNDQREDLRNHLNLDRRHNYATLTQSDGVREGLALYLDLGRNAD